MRDDFLGPDAQDLYEIERDMRAAERAELLAYWAAQTGCRCGLQLGHGGDCQDGGVE